MFSLPEHNTRKLGGGKYEATRDEFVALPAGSCSNGSGDGGPDRVRR